jgi:hypothetical protein
MAAFFEVGAAQPPDHPRARTRGPTVAVGIFAFWDIFFEVGAAQPPTAPGPALAGPLSQSGSLPSGDVIRRSWAETKKGGDAKTSHGDGTYRRFLACDRMARRHPVRELSRPCFGSRMVAGMPPSVNVCSVPAIESPRLDLRWQVRCRRGAGAAARRLRIAAALRRPRAQAKREGDTLAQVRHLLVGDA